MSGGAYNYLCNKSITEIYDSSRTDLGSMRDRLIELGYLDAAKETESIILIFDSFRIRMEARMERLQDVWRSVEWYDSGDYGMSSVQDSIEKYREG